MRRDSEILIGVAALTVAVALSAANPVHVSTELGGSFSPVAVLPQSGVTKGGVLVEVGRGKRRRGKYSNPGSSRK